MAISMDTGGGGGNRRRRGKKAKPIADINMTPFIDVVLVLLIIFMVSAPMMTSGIPIELPKSAAKPMQDETKPINISVSVKGEYFVNDKKVSLEELPARLRDVAKKGEEERIYIRADKTVDYGQIMKVMGTVSAAGYKRIGLVSEKDEK